MPLFTRICSSQEVSQVGIQTALWGDEEGTTENVWGYRSNDRSDFLTIWENVLTVSQSDGSEERTVQSHPHPGGLQEGAGGGAKNGAMANFAEALRQQSECCMKCLKIVATILRKLQNGLCITVVYCGLLGIK
jgi:hypothetical protein